jgi:hypothetical protein
VLALGVGFYLMYVAYEAVHKKTTAAPLTKATASIS